MSTPQPKNGPVRTPITATIEWNVLVRTARNLLTASGYPDDAAELVAESLVAADARGVPSHGVSRIRIYSERVRAGIVDATAIPTVTGQKRAARLVNAHNAPGQVAAQVAVDEAIVGARDLGICAVGVIGSNHCGALAFFLDKIAAEGLVGIAATNAPPAMTYFGGRSRAVGTNPLGYAFPRAGGPPIILDMATSTAAKGKIISMAQAGVEQIPAGWAVDIDGNPTTDTQAALAGSVIPFGGPKGSGLAMLVELLCGTLLSGVSGDDLGDLYDDFTSPQRLGHFFVAIDPAAFGPVERFEREIARFTDTVGLLPPAAGANRVLLPGDVEQQRYDTARRDGVPVSESTHIDLIALAEELGIDPLIAPLESV